MPCWNRSTPAVDQQDVPQLVVRLLAPAAPSPGRSRLRRLVESARAAGLACRRRADRGDCELRGEAAQDVEPGEFGLALQAGVQSGLGLTRPIELQPAHGRQALSPEVVASEVEWPGRNDRSAVDRGPAACTRSCPTKKWSNAVVGLRAVRRAAFLRRPPPRSPALARQAARRRWYARVGAAIEPPGPTGAGPLRAWARPRPVIKSSS